ncbi:bifunctional transcriptional activator/DNA repair enzyme AdaA [Alteriqipengyuania lutimaris]|uniref:methylated-DNA--[protein]-cysteine S-methyltransferase n=1 Tax=Alteriqipengyuania lutimaris TaxID=1538146 RepID=A0A395LN62_9SPHN|nr:methylated-DNA--[protein]-cysteine S-methyltransferase [Alteriqipengyuania lutimaris]MBB3035523.1 AraC family transcriptional regulator of adaptative response/methylated-DNA-[protein]-cysteine methyltransferase [Alteriqipengyuania lutimaris]RDS76080.1 methylated-DNA--[protein]-cysteine S-methyltransferase [Alteriqipengyuania lutimaris]
MTRDKASDAIDAGAAWNAVMRRDRAFDGRFVTGVLTTGIYCRPSCAARHPARGNVRFFADGAAARAAGLRPCKRCLPDDVARDEAAVRAAIDAIRGGEHPTLAELGAVTGYSSGHIQRVFKRATGLSPAAYARALKEERARDALSGAARVTDAIYDAGYEAPSRFYAAMEGKMGMSPSAWRNGGRGATIRWAVVQTTLGEMLVAATDKGVCRLSFAEGEAELRARFPAADLVEGGEDFAALLAEVIAAVERPGTGSDIPLDVQGTAFQEACWQALRAIPSGETRSYGELAAALGNPKASRAVGGANGANNVAVLIPCHRVIAADGGLGGYAYGTKIKQELLKREGEQ